MNKNIILFLVIGILLIGCINFKEKPSNFSKPINETPPSTITAKTTNFSEAKENKSLSRFYNSDSIEFNPQVPEYELPLKESMITNFENFNSKLELKEGKESLMRNGFVIIKNPYNSREEDIIAPYDNLKDSEIPIFITSDSLLHLYHIQFDETLRQIEEKEFYENIWDISKELLDKSVAEYNSVANEEIKEAAKRNVAYFSVGLSLLKPNSSQLCNLDEWECKDPGIASAYFTSADLDRYNFEVPSFVKDNVTKEIALMNKHEGFAESPIFFYHEDYSQYVPRGHYTRSEKLKNYFKAFMWYGRMSMLLNGADDIFEGKTEPENPKGLISTKDAKIQTISAALISSYLDQSNETMQKWDRIYTVTAFYVGLSDDLGPYEYRESIGKLFGKNFKVEIVKDESIRKLKIELAKYGTPKIYGGTGECEVELGLGEHATPEDQDTCLDKSKGFRLMGQRFIPDSYMFSELVVPNTNLLKQDKIPFTSCFIPDYGDVRCFPTGLDVMALLGSKQALKLLDSLGDSNYEGYAEKFNNLTEEVNKFSIEDWNQNLYWSWLYSLRSLLKENGKGHPTFMQTEAWQQKQLHSALASWTELRHDTILYAKQSYTMTITVTGYSPPPPEKPVVGYIEPVPEFYNRLLSLSKMTRDGLYELDALDDISKARVARLIVILERLRNLSEKELENQELVQEDYDFIKKFGDELNEVITEVDEKAKKTSIVADVHTDQNTKQVLEEGVGYVDLIVVAYKLPDGRILIGSGPVLSYYEFKQPMADRLTDEKWRELLRNSKEPNRPEWTKSFIVS